MLALLRQLGSPILVHVAAETLAIVATPEVLAERQRCRAILEHEEARGRPERAQHFAFCTDLSAEIAISILATEK